MIHVIHDIAIAYSQWQIDRKSLYRMVPFSVATNFQTLDPRGNSLAVASNETVVSKNGKSANLYLGND